MSDTTVPGMSRRQLLEAAGAAAAAVAAAGMAGPAVAQAPAEETREIAALQVVLRGPLPDIVTIPLERPLMSGRPALTGESPLLGQVAYVDDHEGRVGLDGNPLFANGQGVLTGANGDALFLQWVQIFSAPTPEGVLEGTGAFIVTGGKGRYCGATGSGSLRVQTEFAAQRLTFTYDGKVAIPTA